jgi:Ca2+-binding EF-hand superfamily protein
MKTIFTTKSTLQASKLIGVLAASLIAVSASQAFAANPNGAHPVKQAAIDAIKAADTNKDGLISRAEAEAGLPKVAKHFDQLDTNKDGQISADEFKAGHHKVKQMHIAKADADKDGFISRAEAEANAPRLAKHFDEIDTNKDGKLSREEIQAARAKMHKKGA